MACFYCWVSSIVYFFKFISSDFLFFTVAWKMYLVLMKGTRPRQHQRQKFSFSVTLKIPIWILQHKALLETFPSSQVPQITYNLPFDKKNNSLFYIHEWSVLIKDKKDPNPVYDHSRFANAVSGEAMKQKGKNFNGEREAIAKYFAGSEGVTIAVVTTCSQKDLSCLLR